ncbi:tRNA 2-thiocytidine biosynthesis protein TtcA [Bacilli bacterium PM5-3]|nr:tRNA 2-thiocytidine biosynthesis protein TtcA [Bacilli bacterium PM5-3]MDH6603570.1 tRNA 2-thiocytidine biosynthesis protein TtcA [Bacilli bacterium PM5-9]
MNEKLDIKEIERSLIKKYRKKIWRPFIKALNEYELIQENDKIAVCISGGKDSLLLAKLLQELHRHSKVAFELKFIAMDPGFHKENRNAIIDNCAHLEIPVEIFDSKIFDVVDKMSAEFPCYLCARMRRGALYSFAKELGCNKIALGHHFDDVIETTLMNVLYSGTFKTMLPKLKAQNFENMELIRPMVLIKEKDIISFTKNTGLQMMDCGCEVAAGKIASTRSDIKELIKDYKKIFDGVDKSIFAAGTNVNIDAIIGYTKDGVKHSFLEDYDKGADE